MTDYRVVFVDRTRPDEIIRDVSYIDYRREPYYMLFYGDDGDELPGFPTADIEGVRTYSEED